MDQSENGSPSRLLTKALRNAIFTAVKKGGLDPNGLDFNDSGAQFRIKHNISGSHFTISGDFGNHEVCRVVGDNPKIRSTAYVWGQVTNVAEMWAWQAKLDLETPDYWAELQRDTKLLGVVSDGVTENAPFTPDEQKAITGRLQGLADDIGQKFSLSSDQTKVLSEKIAYLAESSGRLGRKDWLDLFIGVIVTFAVTIAFPPESIRAVIITAVRAIGLLYTELPFDT